jgi:hypothetical protein
MGAAYSLTPLRVRPEAEKAVASEIRHAGLKPHVRLARRQGQLELEVTAGYLPLGRIADVEDLVAAIARKGWIDPPVQLLMASFDDEPYCLLAVSSQGIHQLSVDDAIRVDDEDNPNSAESRISSITLEVLITGGLAVPTRRLPKELLSRIRKLLASSA